jgi:hypothetical protein
MAVKGDINSKNPKILSLRKLLEEEEEKVTLFWVLLWKTTPYPHKNTHHKTWIKTKEMKTRKPSWQNIENNIKKSSKKEIKWNKETKR